MNGYLLLRDIRPAQNRYRVYEIQMGSITIKEQTYFSVILAWGRVGHRKQRKIFLCSNREEVDKLLKPVLRTRYRHGYQLADKSRSFPPYTILKEFKEASPLPSLQLSLFAF